MFIRDVTLALDGPSHIMETRSHAHHRPPTSTFRRPPSESCARTASTRTCRRPSCSSSRRSSTIRRAWRPAADVRDLRGLLWSSIDNDTSRDLDQLEVAELLPDGTTKVMVAIADVDAFVPKDSPIDQHAARQTMTVYTGVRNFSMLPEQLSTGATSLQEAADRLAVVVEFVVGADGARAVERRLPRGRSKWRPACLHRGRGVARGPRRRAAEGRGVGRAAGAAEAPERRRAGAQERAVSTWRPQHRDHRDPADPRGREGDRRRKAGEEPRDRADRGLHDCVQRSRRPAPRGAAGVVDPAGREGAEAVGTHRGARGDAGRTAAGRARFESAQRIPDRAQSGRSRSLCRSVARRSSS